MKQLRIPAVFMRGGTSKALMLKRSDLPQDEALWPALFRAMLGSPDSNGRQLDGMGGGLSSLSKICVIGPSSRPDADVDYTFAQVSVSGDTVDFSGNCGNMSSAVGPFAVDEKLVSVPLDGEALIRIHNTNTGKIIHARFAVADGEVVTEGDTALPGVAGTGAPVRLSFLDPAGTLGHGLLPARVAIFPLPIPDGRVIEASLIDAAMPCVFVKADNLGADPARLPEAIDADAELMQTLEHLRRQASVAMKIAPDMEAAARIIAIPKIAMVASPQPFHTLSGGQVSASQHDLLIRMISAGQAHRAVPVTGALALASAAMVEGSTVAACLKCPAGDEPLRLGTPSGVIEVGAVAKSGSGREPEIAEAYMIRTQRRLMEGAVCVPAASKT